MRKPLSIYIHIPFCAKKCNYCAFLSMSATDAAKLRFVDALKAEIELRGKELSGKSEVKTIYVGGGTPSVLPDGVIADILNTVYKYFVVANNAEVTVEVNPTSITRSKVKEYLASGVTRISMGLQAGQDHHLKTLGRTHSVEEFRIAVKTIRDAGISNISGDLILGIPDQKPSCVTESIGILKDLNHISIYMLELDEDTPLKRMVESGQLSIPTESETVKLYNTAKTELEKLGFMRYEISNFSKPGCESRHNQVYWARENYLGFGAGAHSFLDGTRFANTSKVDEYVSNLLDNKTIALDYKESLTMEEELEESIMLGLRTTAGISLPALAEKYGAELIRTKKETIKGLVKDGFLSLSPDGVVAATDKGFMVLNKLISLILD